MTDTTRQIGRVEAVDIISLGRQPCLSLRFKLADGSGHSMNAVVTRELLRDYLDVWPAEALQETRTRLCWVVHTDQAITALEPLMPDEGEVLLLAEQPAAPETPAANGSAQPDRDTLLRTYAAVRDRGKEYGVKVPPLKREFTDGEIGAVLEVWEATVAAAEEQARKTVAEAAA
jgi:hypothetical protein